MINESETTEAKCDNERECDENMEIMLRCIDTSFNNEQCG